MPTSCHASAVSRGLSWAAKLGAETTVDILERNHLQGAIRVQLTRTMFTRCATEVMMSEKLFSCALDVFLQLLINPDMILEEDEKLHELLRNGVAFVKSRNTAYLSFINPRISLPFLFACSKMKEDMVNKNDPRPMTNQLSRLLMNITESLNAVH